MYPLKFQKHITFECFHTLDFWGINALKMGFSSKITLWQCQSDCTISIFFLDIFSQRFIWKIQTVNSTSSRIRQQNSQQCERVAEQAHSLFEVGELSFQVQLHQPYCQILYHYRGSQRISRILDTTQIERLQITSPPFYFISCSAQPVRNKFQANTFINRGYITKFCWGSTFDNTDGEGFSWCRYNVVLSLNLNLEVACFYHQETQRCTFLMQQFEVNRLLSFNLF